MSTFHHPADLATHHRFLQCTALLNATLPVLELHDMDQFRVAVDDHIWVMGHDDELTTQLVLANLPHNQIVDQVVVQIVRLIEDNGFLAESQ